MPYRKILLATDGSEHALKAAAQAAQLATACRMADVEILGVAVEYAPLKGRNPFMQAMETEAERVVEATAQVVAENGVQASKMVKLATGNPGHTICEVAREVGADLIVMGAAATDQPPVFSLEARACMWCTAPRYRCCSFVSQHLLGRTRGPGSPHAERRPRPLTPRKCRSWPGRRGRNYGNVCFATYPHRH